MGSEGSGDEPAGRRAEIDSIHYEQSLFDVTDGAAGGAVDEENVDKIFGRPDEHGEGDKGCGVEVKKGNEQEYSERKEERKQRDDQPGFLGNTIHVDVNALSADVLGDAEIPVSGDEVSPLVKDASEAGKFEQKDRRQKQ